MTLPILKKSGIYSFKNKLNGKVYVGQSKDVLTRKKQHERGDTNNSRRFHNAMVKHGPEGFDFQVLEYCEINLLDERESYWITELRSLYPLGYNLTTGGGAFQKHNEETKRIFSQNQKKRVEIGIHIFTSTDFQKSNTLRQVEEAKLGRHPSQRSEFQEKRNKTVQDRIAENGAFFRHSPETIASYRGRQQELYAQGQGKFQDPAFIKNNSKLVKEKLAEGKHHSQQADWSEKASKAAGKQKKTIVLAIRSDDGVTFEKKYSSLNEAERDLGMSNSHLSALCNDKNGVKTVKCKLGIIIKGTFGDQPTWDLSELSKMPDSAFTRMIAIKFTIETSKGNLIYKIYDGIREGCIDLGADKSAVRWVLKGEKYKSTKSNLGRIIKVETI